MKRVHKGLDDAEIEAPDNLVTSYVCNVTGLLASSGCTGSTEYFLDGTQPKKYCDASHNIEDEVAAEEGVEEIPEGTEEIPEEVPEGGNVEGGETVPEEITPIEPETSRPDVEANTPDDVISLE